MNRSASRRVAILLGALTFITGCTSSQPTSEESSGTVTKRVTKTATVTVTPSANPTTSPSPSSTTNSGSDAVTVLPTAVSLRRSPELYFRSPSGNIQCWLRRFEGSPSATCVPTEKDYEDPVDFGCELDVVPEFFLDHDGAHYGDCRGDVVGIPGQRVLAYGTAAENGSIKCGSLETGVTCVDADTGHGFKVSRASYTMF
jgi:hypothetical protein